MTQKKTKIVCKQCGRDVVLNGIGSDRNFWQSLGTNLLGIFAPVTCNIFRPASDIHDEAVHRGKPDDEDFNVWYKRIDSEFYINCIQIANKRDWTRYYFRKQAGDLYWALQLNAGEGYPRLSCNHRTGDND